MTDPVVVFDSGVLDRVTSDGELRNTVRELVAAGWLPVVPTVTLAETVTGRPTDAPVNHVVARIGTVDTSQAVARLAGRLRFAARRDRRGKPPGGIDAMVAAHAAEAGAGVVFTTDPDDLGRLLADHPRVVVQLP